MRTALLILALFIAGCVQPTIAQTATLVLPETGNAIKLSFVSTGKSGYGFRSLTIFVGGKRTRFIPRDPILRVPDSDEAKEQLGIWTDIAGLKLDSSRFFLVGHYTADARPHTLLFFLGEAGIGAAPVFVVGFSDDGQPSKVFESSALDVTSLRSTDYGALIIGKASLSEVMGGDGYNGSKSPYATTYDPFSVYVVHPSAPAVYSLLESRAYNQKNYVWAGPRVREDYAVFYNLPGHRRPFGAAASKVNEILARAVAK